MSKTLEFVERGFALASIMTTKEVSAYLRLHEITVGKYAAEGKIPAIRIGRVWRFDKDRIDEWIGNGGQVEKEEKKPTIRRKK
jgi:excisionase family DNA binding protein